jgi:hypothetical protein
LISVRAYALIHALHGQRTNVRQTPRRKPLDPGHTASAAWPGAKGLQRYSNHPVICHSVLIEAAGWCHIGHIVHPQTSQVASQKILSVCHRQSLQVMSAPSPAISEDYTDMGTDAKLSAQTNEAGGSYAATIGIFFSCQSLPSKGIRNHIGKGTKIPYPFPYPYPSYPITHGTMFLV